MDKIFVDSIKMFIPIYGDIAWHRICSLDRKRARERVQKSKLEDKQLDEREDKFKQELSGLLNKYKVREEPGSLVSLPPRYVAYERSNDIVIKATIIPEIATYFAKYATLTMAFNQFLLH